MYDAQADVQAYASFPSITPAVFMRLISEAMVRIQRSARVIKKVITVNSGSLDANGSIALDRSITLPVRVTYTPISGQPIFCEGRGPDEFNEIKMYGAPGLGIPQFWPVPHRPKIIFCVEQNRLWFWPFSGLTGSFSLVSLAKIGVYQPSAVTDPTSFWYEWAESSMATTQLPQELDGAEIEIVKYVAAQLLTFIKDWKKRFFEDYKERMAIFEGAPQKVLDNAPRYTENYEPHVDFGF